MKLEIFFILLILLALPTISIAQELDLNINGVSLDSTLATVKTKLGKPISEKKRKAGEECFSKGQYFTNLKYTGLVIELLSDEKGKNYKVVSIEITSNKWKVGNTISIGSTQKQVQDKFGKPKNNSTDNGETYFDYAHKGELSGVSFIFRKEKLVKISFGTDLC
jgi:hypothetical protein